MNRRHVRTTTVTLVALGAMLAAGTVGPASGAGAAQQSPAHRRRAPRSSVGWSSPLSAAVARDGTAYVTQNFAGVLTRRSPGGRAVPIYRAGRGTEVGGVSVKDHRVTFTLTTPKGAGIVRRIDRSGDVRTLARVSDFERRANPDGDVVYGFRGIDASCADQFPAGQPAVYPGIVESHPYATAVGDGPTYVADAAANAIFRISRSGTVHTVAVLPAVPVVVNAAAAAAAGLPPCVVGQTDWLEPVPTDVELLPSGALVVSTLTGGPEDGSLGALSRVYWIAPGSHTPTKVADGLSSAVGVAVARNGDMYVSELFANRIAKIVSGTSTPTTYRQAPMPGAVEWRGGDVWATTNVLAGPSEENPDAPPGGRLVRFWND